MKASRRVVGVRWWRVLWFGFVISTVASSGILLLGVGVFLTAPLWFAAMAYLYDDIMGQEALKA